MQDQTRSAIALKSKQLKEYKGLSLVILIPEVSYRSIEDSVGTRSSNSSSPDVAVLSFPLNKQLYADPHLRV